MQQDVTYCTGYWDIDNNPKRDWNHYQRYIPKTLELLRGQRIIFFYESEAVRRYIEDCAKSENIIFRKKNIEDLPTYGLVKNHFLPSCIRQSDVELKQINRFWEGGLINRDLLYERGGPDVYTKIVSLWTSKLSLLERQIRENSFATQYFCWADISISRLNRKRRNWNFLAPTVPYREDVFYFYPSLYRRYYGVLQPISGGLLLGHHRILSLVANRFLTIMNEARDSCYAHDDETLFSLLYENAPEIKFQSIENMARDRWYNELRFGTEEALVKSSFSILTKLVRLLA